MFRYGRPVCACVLAVRCRMERVPRRDPLHVHFCFLFLVSTPRCIFYWTAYAQVDSSGRQAASIVYGLAGLGFGVKRQEGTIRDTLLRKHRPHKSQSARCTPIPLVYSIARTTAIYEPEDERLLKSSGDRWGGGILLLRSYEARVADGDGGLVVPRRRPQSRFHAWGEAVELCVCVCVCPCMCVCVCVCVCVVREGEGGREGGSAPVWSVMLMLVPGVNH